MTFIIKFTIDASPQGGDSHFKTEIALETGVDAKARQEFMEFCAENPMGVEGLKYNQRPFLERTYTVMNHAEIAHLLDL